MTLRGLKSSAGFTYIAALVMVVISGIMLSQVAIYWKTTMQREREVELIYRGLQIRTAMQRWYKFKPPVAGQAPAPQPGQVQAPVPLPNLDALVIDPGSASKVRYLRKPNLVDPITGKDWALVKDGAKIIGVASTSEDEPIKQDNFPDEVADFKGKKKYSEWQFIYNHIPAVGATAGSINVVPK